jgi:hypothetical protein
MHGKTVCRAFSEQLAIEHMMVSLYDDTVTDEEKLTLVDDKKLSGAQHKR